MSDLSGDKKVKAGRLEQGVKLRGAEKVARNPVKVIATDRMPRKPDWIRVRLSNSPKVDEIKRKLRANKLHRSEEHTSELQSRENLVCRLLLEKKKKQ